MSDFNWFLRVFIPIPQYTYGSAGVFRVVQLLLSPSSFSETHSYTCWVFIKALDLNHGFTLGRNIFTERF